MVVTTEDYTFIFTENDFSIMVIPEVQTGDTVKSDKELNIYRY